jgi:hypothetical protein
MSRELSAMNNLFIFIVLRIFARLLSGTFSIHPHFEPFTDFATGEKAKEQKESQARDAENQSRAGQIYSTPSAQDIDTEFELSGLPWGSLSLRHVVERGKASRRESYQAGSFQGSPEYEYSSYSYGANSGGSGRGSSDP